MHDIIYIRANFEPWWMFEGWQDQIISQQQFTLAENARNCLEELKKEFSQRFVESEQREVAFSCYWNEEEVEYCESCEEDLQIFHGLIWLFNGNPQTSF
ncbi:DUF1033 family protein [Planococcus sp. ANT_H30]|uniref:DUF1033 family protein n=1 Tax=Planococcus sp. ANT_H30 TaxID=2597347 RepID=UPI0011EF6D56|nr:DUF1033 family protein [Planococcus sp. ANT_H30]KAA0956470.1 DUF1033 family protein [Planococcus sp. ANT_H30]